MPRVSGASTEGWAIHDHSPSPLMLAASGGHLEAVRALVQAKASVRPVDSLHTNALHLAAAGGHVGVIELLLSDAAGAPRDARTLNKWSAVHHAAFHGHVPAIQTLARHGASLNLKDRWSRTPLVWAVFNAHFQAAEYLIGAGARLLEGGEHGRNQPQVLLTLAQRWGVWVHLKECGLRCGEKQKQRGDDDAMSGSDTGVAAREAASVWKPLEPDHYAGSSVPSIAMFVVGPAMIGSDAHLFAISRPGAGCVEGRSGRR